MMNSKTSNEPGFHLLIYGSIFFVILATIVIYLEPSNEAIKEALTFFVLSITALLFLYTCFLMRETNRLTNERNEKYNSLDIIREWRSQEMREMRKKVWRECANKECESPEKCSAATEMYNFFEMLSLAYYSGHANRMMLKNAFREVFNEWYNKCDPWLRKQSEIAGDKKRERQKQITALHREWRLSESPPS